MAAMTMGANSKPLRRSLRLPASSYRRCSTCSRGASALRLAPGRPWDQVETSSLAPRYRYQRSLPQLSPRSWPATLHSIHFSQRSLYMRGQRTQSGRGFSERGDADCRSPPRRVRAGFVHCRHPDAGRAGRLFVDHLADAAEAHREETKTGGRVNRSPES
jgi:hypothetical protein